MIVKALINTPGRRGTRTWVGAATKFNYGIKTHGSYIEVDTRDVARTPGLYLNARTGKPYIANETGTKIMVEEADIVSKDTVNGVAERGDVNREYERTMTHYRARTALRRQIEDDAYRRSLQAKGQLDNPPADEQAAVKAIQDSLDDPVTALTAVPGIGEATATKLVEAGVTFPMELVGLTKEQLVEIGVPATNAGKVMEWLESNIEVVQDE